MVVGTVRGRKQSSTKPPKAMQFAWEESRMMLAMPHMTI
jgi:hypothetical protein